MKSFGPKKSLIKAQKILLPQKFLFLSICCDMVSFFRFGGTFFTGYLASDDSLFSFIVSVLTAVSTYLSGTSSIGASEFLDCCLFSCSNKDSNFSNGGLSSSSTFTSSWSAPTSSFFSSLTIGFFFPFLVFFVLPSFRAIFSSDNSSSFASIYGMLST